MAEALFQIATEGALDAELVKLCRSPIPAETHFGNELKKYQDENNRHAVLATASGRILRSCVFDVFESLRRVCDKSSMLVHMCFVNRHDVAGCDGIRLMPSGLGTWDGFDELKPQEAYKNDWETPILPPNVLAGLSGAPDTKPSGLVRSFLCFWESYFESAGSFVVRLPDSVDSNQLVFVRSNSIQEDPITVPHGWEAQEELNGAVLAFSKFTLQKFLRTYPAGANHRTLYLISVGSNVLPWGDLRRSGKKDADWESAPSVQAVWVVLSLLTSETTDDTLRELSRTILGIDAAMTQSLVFDLAQKQQEVIGALEHKLDIVERMRETIRLACEPYRAFSDSISLVFRDVQPSNAILAELANDLSNSLFLDRTSSYRSLADGTTPLQGIHTLNESDTKTFQAHHRKDLAIRLKKYLGDDRLQAFTKHMRNDEVARLKFLKRHVHDVFADRKAERNSVVTLGAIRAGIFWKFGALSEAGDDEVFLYVDKTFVDDYREFIGAFTGIIDAWLQPGDTVHGWILETLKRHGGINEYHFSGGGSVTTPNSEKLDMLVGAYNHDPENIKVSGGNLETCIARLLLAVPTKYRVACTSLIDDEYKICLLNSKAGCSYPYEISMLYRFDKSLSESGRRSVYFIGPAQKLIEEIR